MKPLLLVLLALLAAGAAPLPRGTTVVVALDGLRSDKGVVLACLTRVPAAFPDCSKDPRALRLEVPAGEARSLAFAGVAPGRYAISVLHDENGNGLIDRALMLPREGFGFSRNPQVRFGPPRFARASFQVGAGPVSQDIQMRYLL
jgi:uncharacterized protein (DUF2141 family)